LLLALTRAEFHHIVIQLKSNLMPQLLGGIFGVRGGCKEAESDYLPPSASAAKMEALDQLFSV
jgi:hypothetical protein